MHFEHAHAILNLLADPEAAKQVLEKLKAASDHYRGLIEQEKAERTKLEAERRSHAEAIAAERAKFDDERAAFNVESTTRREALDERERKIAARELSAEADAQANAQRRADLEYRLEQMQLLAR
jgi:hypothetical protein